MWEESRIRDVAGRQYGLVGRGQLLIAGTSDHEISRQIANSRLQVVHPGVYYLDCTPATWRTEVLAATLAAGPDALASHRSAAVLWGMDAIYGRVIEVTVPYVESPEPAGAIVHRTRRPNAPDVLEGIPITSPAKTILDLARFLPDRTLWKAARSAIHKGLTTVAGLDETVRKYGGRGVTGTKAMRRAIRIVAEDESGSPAEIDFHAIVMKADVPPPVQQLRIRLSDGTYAYPDFAWPQLMRIVEVDGFSAHGTPEQLEQDLRRQNALMDIGWNIRRFTATRIRDEPQIVEAEIVRFVNAPIL